MTRFFFAFMCFIFTTGTAFGQTALSFPGLQADRSDPIEVSSDSLSLDQTVGSAVFETNVLVSQGALRLSAEQVVVTYTDEGGIDRMVATGGVTLVTEAEAAEADSATYDLGSGTLTMQGNVMVTQGTNAILADQMGVDLDTGNAQLTGRVRSVLQQDN